MASSYTKTLIIVVDTASQAVANTHGKAVDAVGGELTFTVGLSPDGKAPATHYWCDWSMQPGEETALKALLAALQSQGKVQIFDGKSSTPNQVLAQLSLQRIGG